MNSDSAVGFAFFFENIVVFSEENNPWDVVRTVGKKKAGEFLGKVLGVIPVDPYQTLYEWIKHTPAFHQRRNERKILKKLNLSRRKMGTMKRNGQRTLTNFKRKPWSQERRNLHSKRMVEKND